MSHRHWSAPWILPLLVAGGAIAQAGPASRPASAPAAPPGMVWIPGGEFRMGADDQYPEERPTRPMRVAGFWIDRHEVTNRRFAEFVRATGHVTEAERPPTREQYPDARNDLLVAGSAVFTAIPDGQPAPELSWWHYVPGADWRHPSGPDSSIAERMDHPVVQVTWADAQAFARWAGCALPTEAQWEWAARAGSQARYAWGDEFRPGGRFMANTFQGEFPRPDQGLDGFVGTAPVGSFPPNGFGLFDMIGNAWEWTAEVFDPTVDAAASQPSVRRRTLRGGSFLCAPDYCCRYRPSARIGVPEDTSTNHIGFRCVRVPEAAASRPAGTQPGR